MPDVYRILGQVAPEAETTTNLYVVPANVQVPACRVWICNRDTATTFRLSLAPAGVEDANEQFIAYDMPIDANESMDFGPFCLLSADVIRVWSKSGGVSFTVTGLETS